MFYISLGHDAPHTFGPPAAVSREEFHEHYPELLPRIDKQVKLLQEDVSHFAVTHNENEPSVYDMADELSTAFRHLLAMKISIGAIEDAMAAHFCKGADSPGWLRTYWRQLDECEAALTFYLGEFDATVLGEQCDMECEGEDDLCGACAQCAEANDGCGDLHKLSIESYDRRAIELIAGVAELLGGKRERLE